MIGIYLRCGQISSPGPRKEHNMNRHLTAIGRVSPDGIELVTGPSLVCSDCGDTEDVVVRVCRVSEDKTIESTECRDRVACWARWDKQFGVKSVEETKVKPLIALRAEKGKYRKHGWSGRK